MMKKRTGAPIIVRRGGPIKRRRPSSELVVERVQRKKPNRPKPPQQQKKKKKKPAPPPRKKKIQKRRVRLDPKEYPPEKRRGKYWRVGEDGLPDDEKVRGLAKECLTQLIEVFPNLFVTNEQAIKPLKVGILKDIMQSEFRGRFKNKIIRIALKVYCSSRSYREVVAKGGERFDLQGSAAGSVSDVQQLSAMNRLHPKES